MRFMLANLFGGDGLIVIVVALVVLVGGAQLPKIARNVGLAGKEFRKAQHEAEEEGRASAEKSAAMPPPTPIAAPLATTPLATTPLASTPIPPVQVPASQPVVSEQAAITMTPAQLDELLKAHEARVRGESNNN